MCLADIFLAFSITLLSRDGVLPSWTDWPRNHGPRNDDGMSTPAFELAISGEAIDSACQNKFVTKMIKTSAVRPPRRHRSSLANIRFTPLFGTTLSSCLHRYRYNAIQRYRAAHEDIMSAISKKDKALQKMLKHTDPATLMEISEEAVTSSGIGVYTQKRVTEGSESMAGPSLNQPTERPDQLRQKFAQSLKVRTLQQYWQFFSATQGNANLTRRWYDKPVSEPEVLQSGSVHVTR